MEIRQASQVVSAVSFGVTQIFSPTARQVWIDDERATPEIERFVLAWLDGEIPKVIEKLGEQK